MSKRILFGIAAVVLAAIGTTAVLAYARGADRRALEGQQAISAYVVRKDVPAGTTARKAIDDGLIVKELIASKGVPEGALTGGRHRLREPGRHAATSSPASWSCSRCSAPRPRSTAG